MSEARLRPSSNMLPNRENVACCVKIRNINRDMITVTSQMLTGISSVLICRFSLCWRISAGIKSQNKEKMTTKQQIIVIILSICTDFVQLFSPSYASKVDFNSISLKFWGTVRVKNILLWNWLRTPNSTILIVWIVILVPQTSNRCDLTNCDPTVFTKTKIRWMLM